MGRPLNKKYFGNRNIGSTSTTADNGIGGEGIASINWSTLGSFMGNSNVAVLTVPDLPAPTLPSGVQATWSVLFEVESVTTGAGKTDLAVGDTFGYAGVPGLIAKVTDLSGANAIFSVTTTGASRGSSLTLAAIPQDTQTVNMTKIAGSGTAETFTVDILFRVASVSITEKGSGYVGTETFTFTKPGTTTGTVPAGTITLTTDTGSAGASTNQENAIVAYAYIPAADGGTQRLVADIKKQVNDRRFKVKTSEGTGICQLKTSGIVNAAGEMTIKATDQAGKTYYVYRITSRTAVIVPYGAAGHQFPLVDGLAQKVKWTFGAAVAPTTGESGVVTIENI